MRMRQGCNRFRVMSNGTFCISGVEALISTNTVHITQNIYYNFHSLSINSDMEILS